MRTNQNTFFQIERLEFQSENEIINEINSKKIHCPNITTEELLKNFIEVKSAIHKSFFRRPKFDYLISLLNQFKYYRTDGTHFGFIDDIHELAVLIKSIRTIPSAKKLLDVGIFSDFGVFSQFLVTIWVSKYLNVVDLEVDNPPINTDILAKCNNTNIHFHVKDIREEERKLRIETAILAIESVLSSKLRAIRSEKVLRVTIFTGVPPANLTINYWQQLATNLELKSQSFIRIFQPGERTGNKDPIKIEIEIDWQDWSGTFFSPIRSFSNLQRLEQVYDEFESKINKVNGEIHILVAVSTNTYDWNILKESFAQNILGIVLIDIFDKEITSSPFILPNKYLKVEKYLNSTFPPIIELI